MWDAAGVEWTEAFDVRSVECRFRRNRRTAEQYDEKDEGTATFAHAVHSFQTLVDANPYDHPSGTEVW